MNCNDCILQIFKLSRSPGSSQGDMLCNLHHECPACTCPGDTASDMFSPMKLQIRKMQLYNMWTLASWRTDLHHSQCTLRHSHPCTSLQHKHPPQKNLPSLLLLSQRVGKRFALTHPDSTRPDTNGKYSLQRTCRRGTESQMCDRWRLDFHLELACMLMSLACQNTDLRDIFHTLKHQRP